MLIFPVIVLVLVLVIVLLQCLPSSSVQSYRINIAKALWLRLRLRLRLHFANIKWITGLKVPRLTSHVNNSFCRNNGWLMENHGLGTQNDKMCADSLIPQIPHTIYLAHLQKLANYLGCFWKKKLSSLHCPCLLAIVFQCAKGKFPTLWWASATIFSAIKIASLFTRDVATTPISHN